MRKANRETAPAAKKFVYYVIFQASNKIYIYTSYDETSGQLQSCDGVIEASNLIMKAVSKLRKDKTPVRLVASNDAGEFGTILADTLRVAGNVHNPNFTAAITAIYEFMTMRNKSSLKTARAVPAYLNENVRNQIITIRESDL
jgi:hypothetical protein